ncbi:dTDP-4-dehydrorhamnose 3,5-epimerase [Flavobacterium gillisiae]|uniref:dTDP-4-dehydrorhamnose 3,5-epimerase n=1 Tax=Flavobacterium gillisiae TaxID=150146 RepID=A0A1H4EQH8_9FLAO|nr:WxcM-like domain-containing protein [Flavobacterium gillisiae]SEA87305.1 dTDP-4-dehydrorhamnose 3,5-epimerase [Flavobacterium gillisiae]
MGVQVIEGVRFEDHRGSVSFVNDFKFEGIERFYMIANSDEIPLRAWQGHKLDQKNFFCVAGSFKIGYVKIDNWENPSKNLRVETVVLSCFESRVLHIPAGFANAIDALEKDSKLISFSTLPLSNVQEDDVRYPSDYWRI